MPGMDGFETAEMIHQHPRFENTPIVFVSGVCVSDIDRLKGYRTELSIIFLCRPLRSCCGRK